MMSIWSRTICITNKDTSFRKRKFTCNAMQLNKLLSTLQNLVLITQLSGIVGQREYAYLPKAILPQVC